MEVAVVRNSMGYAAAVNTGLAKTKSDLVWVLNNDVVVDEMALPRLAEAMQKPWSGVGPTVYDYNSTRVQKTFAHIDWNSLELVNHTQTQSQQAPAIAFCAPLIRREVFTKIGLLCEDYFHYFEDNDFFLRCQKKGFKFWYESKAVCWHKGSQSIKANSPRQIYYLNRNRLILLSKFSRVNHMSNLRFFLSCGNKHVRKAIWDFYFRKWGKQL